MKILVILAVIALLIVAAFFFFGGGELAIAPKATPATAGADAGSGNQSYSALINLLTQDMTNIPAVLDAPRVAPASAFSIKSRLAGASAARTEYQTLAQVCDLIIFADKEHSVRQAQAQSAQLSVSGDPMANANAKQLAMAATRTTLHARAQADWEAYRQQTDTEVRRLLATLPR